MKRLLQVRSRRTTNTVGVAVKSDRRNNEEDKTVYIYRYYDRYNR